MAQLTNLEFGNIPSMRVIGREVSVTMAKGVENPVPALWDASFRDGTMEMLDKLPLAIGDCYIGWMGDAVENGFAYIVGIAAVADTPVPEGMQYRDVPACKVARSTIAGNLQNGDVYGNAHEMTVAAIETRGYHPDYSHGWSAEVYPDGRRYDTETGSIDYLCPYTE